MKKIVFIIILTGLITSCKISGKITGNSADRSTSVDAKKDGSSYEKAILINEKTETEGVRAEYAWLEKNYPGYKFIMQSLLEHNRKPYDDIQIRTVEGVEKDIYFDISKFFGKY